MPVGDREVMVVVGVVPIQSNDDTPQRDAARFHLVAQIAPPQPQPCADMSHSSDGISGIWLLFGMLDGAVDDDDEVCEIARRACLTIDRLG